MTSGLPIIVSFWHGPLSWLERLCVTSFVARGHPFHLYSYDDVEGLPKGAERRDAAEIMPQSEMFFYKGKHTPAVFADLFRLKLMQQQAGLWADCDVYCVKPFAGLGDYVFGYEISPDAKGQGGSVNNAIFQCPPDAPLLQKLLDIFDPEKAGQKLPWLPPMRRAEIALRRALGQKIAPADIQFGATGPFPLTWNVNKLGLIDRVQPQEVFYPVTYKAIPELMREGSDIAGHVTDRTLGVHIWRSQLTRRGRADMPLPEKDSALAKLCAAEGIELPD